MHGFKIGAFGSNADRFVDGSAKNAPGPGHYNNNNYTMSVEAQKLSGAVNHYESERPNTQSVFFKSKTDRFSEIDPNNP